MKRSLGAFEKLRKATVRIVMSVLPCVSVRLSAWNKSVYTGWILMKFDIVAHFGNPWRKFRVL